MKALYRWYHDLHQIPEASMQEEQTRKYLIQELKKLHLSPISLTQKDVIVYFDFHQDHTIAFRGEMDGLQIEEETDLSYKSCHLGWMHACGHDGHMAILLGVAAHLSRRSIANSNIVLIFQMAEETIGGAKQLIDMGLKSRFSIDEIYALHNFPGLRSGCFYTRPGPIFSSSHEINLSIIGQGAHVSMRHLGKDSLKAACDLYQQLEARSMKEQVCLHFGKMRAGTIRNGVADKAILEGTLRAFDDKIVQKQLKMIDESIQAVMTYHDVKIELNAIPLYPCVVNDIDLYHKVCQKTSILPIESMFLCDDFAWYQQSIPGLYVLMGNGYDAPLHASTYRFDEKTLQRGLEFYLSLLE